MATSHRSRAISWLQRQRDTNNKTQKQSQIGCFKFGWVLGGFGPVRQCGVTLYCQAHAPLLSISPGGSHLFWEVLHGVGVDGDRGITPFLFILFNLFFFVSFRLCSLFSHSPREQGQTTGIYGKKWGISSNPACADPVQNVPTFKCAFKCARGISEKFLWPDMCGG